MKREKGNEEQKKKESGPHCAPSNYNIPLAVAQLLKYTLPSPRHFHTRKINHD
jgi:hypothetical protein